MAHNEHKRDQAAWLRAGGEQLFEEDYALLGQLAGQRLLHLQCNSGQDSLCLARRGAELTGVDISDEAIAFARELSEQSGIAASFERADVYDWMPEAAAAGRRFDLIYCSYGALCWLSDLDAWARGVASLLAPGGALVIVEFHPIANCFDEQRRLAYDYFSGDEGEVLIWDEGVSDYVARTGTTGAPSGYVERDEPFDNPHPCHEFFWSVAGLLAALRRAELELERLDEHPHMNGCRFYEDMVELPDRRFGPPEGQPRLPLMISLRARRPGLRLVQIDAFTDEDAPFSGNPAAVCLLDTELPEATMQAIAAENNLSETAFLLRLGRPRDERGAFRIRWFTPTTEVDLCGHATLASAHVVLGELEPELEGVEFHTLQRGILRVRRGEGELGEPGDLIMDFPAESPTSLAEPPAGLVEALGAEPRELLQASYHLALFEREAEVRALQPDFAALAQIAPGELIATAPADDPELDFVSRFFAPGVGIDEDPVTGSAHCILAPCWAARLAKASLRARQISPRGGSLRCTVRGDRVELIGRCSVYARGKLSGARGPTL